MIYKIIIRPKALKFIEKQDKIQKLRIYKAIYNLPNGDINKIYYSLYLFFKKYTNIAPTNINNDTICDILKFPIIKLSVLNPSIKNLIKEYSIKYQNVICPLYFWFLLIFIKITNIIKSAIDS